MPEHIFFVKDRASKNGQMTKDKNHEDEKKINFKWDFFLALTLSLPQNVQWPSIRGDYDDSEYFLCTYILPRLEMSVDVYWWWNSWWKSLEWIIILPMLFCFMTFKRRQTTSCVREWERANDVCLKRATNFYNN